MTEAEWLTCTDPTQMLEFLHGKVTERKMHLLACACCRRIWPLLKDRSSRSFVEAVERYADNCFDSSTLAKMAEEAQSAVWSFASESKADEYAAVAAACAANSARIATCVEAAAFAAGLDVAEEGWCGFKEDEHRSQCDLLLELLGPVPIRSASVATSWIVGNDRTIPKIAKGIYDDQAFARLPILADALEDVGCDNADILAHCRGPGPHVRGCWVIDLLLGLS